MKTICLILLFALPQASTDEMDFLFRKGNEFYETGKYQQAIEQYEKILSSGYESGPLYYNLGNVFFKLGQTGKSILYYERAKKLLPRDQDIEFNLKIANLYVADKIKVPEQFFLFKSVTNFKNYFSIDTLGWIVLGFYLITMVLLIIRIFFRQRTARRATNVFLVPVVIILAVFALTLVSRLYDQASISEGVIMQPKIEVLSSPAKDATELFSLHEGVKVRIEDSSGDWLKISLADGKVGWIDKIAIEKI